MMKSLIPLLFRIGNNIGNSSHQASLQPHFNPVRVEKRMCQDVLYNAPRSFPAPLVLFFNNINGQANLYRSSLLSVPSWFHDLVYLPLFCCLFVTWRMLNKKTMSG